MAAPESPFTPPNQLGLPLQQWPLLAMDKHSLAIGWCSPALAGIKQGASFKQSIALEATAPDMATITTPTEWFTGTLAHNQQPILCRLWPGTDNDGLLWAMVIPAPESEDAADIADLQKRHQDFVSVVSHEFRTPLTSIKGFADTLLRYSDNLKPEQRTKFITTIKEQADRLTRMVENLLTVSKLGEGTVQVECRTLPLAPMLERVIENIKAKASQDPLYANRTIALHTPDTITASWADPDKLEQVLTNIIDNAVKYAYTNTEVAVNVSEADDGDMLHVAVTNNGDGIGKDQLPKIFKRFSRADNPLTRQVEGTGLGLYITRNLITAMNGDITVDSTPNQSTTFTIHIPAATAQRQADWHKQREADDANDEGAE